MIVRYIPFLFLFGKLRASGISIFEDTFGYIVNDDTSSVDIVRRFTFTNHQLNTKVQIINYGATITSFVTPDCYGKLDDIVLGFDSLEGYRSPENPYFGATIGRVAGRIRNGTFTVGGKEYQIEKNDGQNSIHGGKKGFDKVLWIPQVTTSDSVTMSYTSPDGESGFPGTIKASVTFTLTLDNRLIIKYKATTNKKTPINLTNHAYFNLAGHYTGEQGLVEHAVKIFSDQYTEVDTQHIPTGEIRSVDRTFYDLNDKPRYLGFVLEESNGQGIDICYLVSGNTSSPVAWVHHPRSGRVLTAYTDQPGLVFYTGGNMRPLCGKDNAQYDRFGAFCLETQKYPDAVHHSNFPSIILKPGEEYTQLTIYEFGLVKNEY